MRTFRLPPVDTTGYVSCPIDTPLADFDHKSPVPCIIVTPSTATEYHIAFHHKDSPLTYSSKFASQQQAQQQGRRQQQSRFRRPFLTAINSFVDSPPGLPQSFETAIHRFPNKSRVRTALILAIPIFIMACHLLATMLMRNIGGGLGHSFFFGGTLSGGGFSTAAAAHLRAQREAQLQPVPEPLPIVERISTSNHVDRAAAAAADPQLIAVLD